MSSYHTLFTFLVLVVLIESAKESKNFKDRKYLERRAVRFENHYLPRTATKEQIEKAYSRNADKNTLIVGDPVKSKEILLKAKELPPRTDNAGNIITLHKTGEKLDTINVNRGDKPPEVLKTKRRNVIVRQEKHPKTGETHLTHLEGTTSTSPSGAGTPISGLGSPSSRRGSLSNSPSSRRISVINSPSSRRKSLSNTPSSRRGSLSNSPSSRRGSHQTGSHLSNTSLGQGGSNNKRANPNPSISSPGKRRRA